MLMWGRGLFNQRQTRGYFYLAYLCIYACACVMEQLGYGKLKLIKLCSISYDISVSVYAQCMLHLFECFCVKEYMLIPLNFVMTERI